VLGILRHAVDDSQQPFVRHTGYPLEKIAGPEWHGGAILLKGCFSPARCPGHIHRQFAVLSWPAQSFGAWPAKESVRRTLSIRNVVRFGSGHVDYGRRFMDVGNLNRSGSSGFRDKVCPTVCHLWENRSAHLRIGITVVRHAVGARLSALPKPSGDLHSEILMHRGAARQNRFARPLGGRGAAYGIRSRNFPFDAALPSLIVSDKRRPLNIEHSFKVVLKRRASPGPPSLILCGERFIRSTGSPDRNANG